MSLHKKMKPFEKGKIFKMATKEQEYANH